MARARSFIRRIALVAVHGDDALDHPVEDRGRLGALLLQVLDLLAQPRREHVERAAEGADLVGASATGARTAKLPSLIRRAMACISTTGRVTRPATKMPMPNATSERHQAAREHHPVDRGVGRRDGGQRQRQPEHADHLPAVDAPGSAT